MFLQKASYKGHSTWGDYLVALFSVALSLFVHWLLDPSLREHLSFLTVYGGIAFAVWYGRWGPAVFAAIAGYLGAKYFFITPGHAITPDYESLARLTGYLFSSGIIIGLGELMHRARDRAENESAERRLAQEAEARQKELLATTLRSIGDAVIATNLKGEVTFLNPEAERLTGWKSAEAAGQPLPEVFRIVNEQTRQPVENPVLKVFRTGHTVALANHTILLANDGRETPIDDSAAPIQHPNGMLSGVVLVFRDFTEQKRAQETNARLAAIVEFSGDAIFTQSLAGVIQSWNAGAERLFGYRAAEIIGRPNHLLFPPERRREEHEILERVQKGRLVERLESVRLAKDGRQIPVSISISPIKDPDGYVIGISEVIQNITDLVAARAALVREKELLATTLASIGDGVILTDARGCVTFLNAEAERLTKWKTAEASGRPLPEIFRIINEDTRATVESPVDKVLRLGTVVGLANHTLLVAKDGTETPIDDSAAPIRQAGDAIHGVVLVFRDFTERKQSEARMEELLARFESLVTYAPTAISLFDSELRFVSVNERAVEVNGIAREAHLGRRPGKLLPHLGARVEELLRQVRDTGKAVI